MVPLVGVVGVEDSGSVGATVVRVSSSRNPPPSLSPHSSINAASIVLASIIEDDEDEGWVDIVVG